MTNFLNLFSFSAVASSSSSVRRAISPRGWRIAALSLALAASGLPVVAAESGTPVAGPDSAVELFSPAAETGVRAMRAGRAGVGREAVRFNRAIADQPLHAKAQFSLPRGVSYELIYDSRQDHPSGNVTWSGYLKDYGDDYRAVITFGSEGVSGRILTPDGEFLIESDADGEWLIDTQAAGLKAVESSEDDALVPLPEDMRKRLR